MTGKQEFPYVFLSARTVCCAVKLCPGGRVDDLSFPALVLHPMCSGLPRGSHRSLQPTNLIRFAFTTASGSMHGNRILLFPRKRRKCDVSGFEPRVRASSYITDGMSLLRGTVGITLDIRCHSGLCTALPQPVPGAGRKKGVGGLCDYRLFKLIFYLRAFVTGL